MKMIGIIGGISWLSSAEYYRLINEMVNQRLGGVHSARLLLYSVDYEEIKSLTFADNWEEIANMIGGIAQKLQNAGAGCLLLGANTMHRVAETVQQRIDIPVIHIADVTGAAIRQQQLKKVALLGTRYTMELDFYPRHLGAYDVSVVLPEEQDRQFIHDIIYNELGRNIFLPATKNRILQIIQSLATQGAEGVILGCTELPLFIQSSDCSIPVFDTTQLHASAAVDWLLS